MYIVLYTSNRPLSISPLGHGGDFTEEVKYSYFDLKNTVFNRNIADSKL